MNRVVLMGRLTKEPELKYLPNNTAVCNFTLAVNRRFTKQGEEKQADFINIVTFGKFAEFCNTYFQKGRQVLVSGRLQIRTWDNDQGQRQYFTEVVADEGHFADGKPEGGGAKPQQNQYQNRPPQQQQQQQQQEFYPINDDDDELPF